MSEPRSLQQYVRLALTTHSYHRLAARTGFSSRQLWNMAGGEAAPALRQEGRFVPPAEDERYLALGREIPPEHGIDPEDVRRAAQASYEARSVRPATRADALPDDGSLGQLAARARAADVFEAFIALEEIVVLILAPTEVVEAFERAWARLIPPPEMEVGYFLPPPATDPLQVRVGALAALVAEADEGQERTRMAVARILRGAALGGPERLSKLLVFTREQRALGRTVPDAPPG